MLFILHNKPAQPVFFPFSYTFSCIKMFERNVTCNTLKCPPLVSETRKKKKETKSYKTKRVASTMMCVRVNVCRKKDEEPMPMICFFFKCHLFIVSYVSTTHPLINVLKNEPREGDS